MKEKHYVGEDLYTKFDVTVRGKPVRVYSTGVQVYGPTSELLVDDTCEKQGNEVSYRLTSAHVKEPGEYVFIFTVGLRRVGRKQHVIREKVNELPVQDKIKRKAKSYAAVN